MDTGPAIGSDVVGSQVTFSAAFAGSLPIAYRWQRDGSDIPGATNATLTVTNLQLADTGAYSLQASNALGVLSSTPNQFTVNAAPDPVGGDVASVLTQTDYGRDALFSATSTISANNLIAGTALRD